LPAIKKLILIVIDGLTPSVFEAAVGDGRAPALTFLAELPKRVSESVTRYRLEQLNRLLIQSMESARDGIMITDLQGAILHVNQALEHLTGYRRNELLGQTPRLFKSGLHPCYLFVSSIFIYEATAV